MSTVLDGDNEGKQENERQTEQGLRKANGARKANRRRKAKGKKGKRDKEGKQGKEGEGNHVLYHCPCQAYLTFEGHLLSRHRPHCLWFFYNLWCICDESDHHEDENDEKDENDDPTCNINDNVGIVAALRIGRSAGHLFSCVAPVVIISL